MSVLFIASALLDSPAQIRQNLILMEALSCQGMPVFLAAPPSTAMARCARTKGMTVLPLPEGGMGIRMRLALGSLLRQVSAAVVHTLDDGALPAGVWLRRRGLPWIHLIQPLHHDLKPPVKRHLEWVDLFADPGGHASSLDGADFQRVRAIPPAAFVAESPFFKHKTRPDDRFVFVVGTELTAERDVSVLIRAMAYLLDSDRNLPQWEVRIIGTGPRFGELLDSAHRMGAASRLCLLGMDSYHSFLAEADAALAPSSTGGGDAPFILDAWNAGLPVACSALPAHQALGTNGLLFSPPGDAMALASSMLRLMQEEETRVKLVQEGKEALTRFTPARLAEVWTALYAETVEAARCRTGEAPPARTGQKTTDSDREKSDVSAQTQEGSGEGCQTRESSHTPLPDEQASGQSSRGQEQEQHQKPETDVIDQQRGSRRKRNKARRKEAGQKKAGDSVSAGQPQTR